MSDTDLHLHSTYSDGTDSASELLQNIRKNGVKNFSLTDHDTFDGCFEMEKITPKDMNFIRGIELTCQIENIKCHILGYGYDLNSKSLKELVEKGKKLRRKKLELRIQHLKDVWNINLTDEELKWLYSRKSVVKIHIAWLLVKRGLAENNVSAMKKYLDACKTGNSRFDGEEATATLKNSGGIIVWAHPLGGEGEEHIAEETFCKQFKTMEQYGIQGLECFYSRYNDKESEFLYKFAKEHNLFVTGGSDYHGKNKQNISIGQLNTQNNNVLSEKLSLLKYFI